MSEAGHARRAVALREVQDEDLSTFFEYLRDPEAQAMAASTFEDYGDTQAFTSYWSKLRRNPTATVRTIVFADDPGTIAGHISVADGEAGTQVRYWVDRPLWGQGIATGALHAILDEVAERPIFAQVVRTNERGIAVLRKNGFNMVGQDTGFDPAKGRMIDDVILRLG